MIRRLPPLLLALVLAACQAVPQHQVVDGDRCLGDRDDARVAEIIGQTPERLKRLRDERSLTNEGICTMPAPLLARAIRRVDTPKPDHPGEWAKWRAMGQRDDTGTIKPNGLGEALAQREAVIERTRAAQGDVARPLAGLDATRWTSLGPVNIPGRVRAILVHPSDGNRIWVGSVSGGIWYTADGGGTWSALNDFQSNLAISSLAMDPSNTSILYAGTGEGFFNADSIRGAGIFRSTDGGQTWIQLSATSPASDTNWYYVNRIAVNPSNSSLILAATGGGVYRTADGGTSWTQITSTRALDVKWDPNTTTRAIAGRADGRVAVSTDSGASFSTVTIVSGGGRVELAFAASSSGTVYASVQVGTGRIYRSTNGGTSWSLRSSPDHLGSQGWYDNTIWVSPTNSNLVVTGGIDLHRSTNGGSSFTSISTWYLWPSSPHADQHAIVHHPSFDGSSNLTVFVGNDGGVWKSTDISTANGASSSNTWSLISNGIVTTQFYGGAASASGGLVVGGTQDNGSLSTTGSTTWTTYEGGDGGYAAVDQTDSNYVYGEYVYAAIHRSTDGGSNRDAYICSGITEGGSYGCGGSSEANFIAPFILDPNSQSRMLVGAASLWITDNAKAATPTWRVAKSPSSTSNNFISAIAVATGNSALIWVGYNKGTVYKTTNGTATSPTWTAVTVGPVRQVMRILIDPSDSNTVYVTYGGYSSGNIRKTTDGGTSWTDISTGLAQAPIRGIARHPTNASWLYVGTEVGIFSSEDGGSTWSTTNDGPGTAPIDEIFFAGFGNWTTQDLFGSTTVNGYGLVTSGQFGGATGNDIFLLASDGSNRLLYRDQTGTWQNSDPFGTQAVNGYELVVSGQFGGAIGSDIFLLASTGANRLLFRDAGGTWQSRDPFSTQAVNGYRVMAKGQFGGATGEDIFLLASNGSNRLLYRDSTGTWQSRDPFGTQTVNGYDFIVAGQFGGAVGDDIFLLARDGANRLLYRDAGGVWQSRDIFSASSVAGFELVTRGRFGGASGDDILLVASDGTSRLLYRDSSGTWRARELLNRQAMNGYSLVTSGQFGGLDGDDVFLASADGVNRRLSQDRSTTTLIAATHGRGMFQASLSTSSTSATPETGWWWYASESGRGFSLEVSGSNLFIAGYLYSTDGAPIWYVSQGARASNGVYQGILQQFSGGQTLSGSYQAPNYLGSVGTVTLSFDTTTSGRLTWPGGTIPFTRYDIVSGGVTAGSAAGMPQKGWWWNAAESGRGYFMEVQGSTMFLATYMYDGTGQATWHISLGAMTSTSLYQGTLTEFRGGQTLAGPYIGPTSSSSAGTITLQFSSQTTATLTLPNGQQVALTRYTF